MLLVISPSLSFWVFRNDCGHNQIVFKLRIVNNLEEQHAGGANISKGLVVADEIFGSTLGQSVFEILEVGLEWSCDILLEVFVLLGVSRIQLVEERSVSSVVVVFLSNSHVNVVSSIVLL